MRNDIRNRLLSKCGCVVLGASLLISQIALADIIPASRLANWSLAGVPGGIPTRTNIFVNVLTTANPAYACTNSVDVSVPLYNAIHNCPSNQVVYLPAGIYPLTNSVYLQYGESYCTIRGDGPGNTIIVSKVGLTSGGYSPNGALEIGVISGVLTNQVWDILGSNPAGTSNITVAGYGAASPPPVGDLVWIDQTNDYYCSSCTATTRPSVLVDCTDYTGLNQTYCDRTLVVRLADEIPGDRNMQHMATVTAVNGNTISFWPPLFWEFDQSKQARVFHIVSPPNKMLGIESLTISNGVSFTVTTNVNVDCWDTNSFSGTLFCTNNPNTSVGLLFMQNAYSCWVMNVEFDNLMKWGMELYNSVQCQVDHCYLHDTILTPAYLTGTFNNPATKDGYGFELHECTSLLFENNIETHLFANYLCHAGCDGDVCAYNYIAQSVDGPDLSYLQATISGSHCGFPMMNLYEGNVTAEFQVDNAGAYNTVFRNLISGTDWNTTGNYKPISLDMQNYYNNVVGNILGKNVFGVTNAVWTYTDTNNNFGEPVIYRLGFPVIGNNYIGFGTSSPTTNAYWATFDTNVAATLLRADNFDYANSNIADSASGTLTNSYYLSSKPAWWGSGTWPPFDPSHPELASITNIPAGYRYVTGVDMPKKSSPLHFYLIVQ